jgi:hypothetical protein
MDQALLNPPGDVIDCLNEAELIYEDESISGT